MSSYRWSILVFLVAASICGCGSPGETSAGDAAQPPPPDAVLLDAPAPPDDGPPAGPGLVAPPLDRSVATSVFDASRFIYTGDDAVQRDVAPSVIEPRRAAVLRGVVTARDGGPIDGALVSLLGHPELGHTVTRSDGGYDLVVNGGGAVVVVIRKGGLLEVQRTVDVPWQAWVAVPEVALVPIDPAATVIDLGAPGVKVARGSVVVDESGTRRATLLFPPGTQATVATDAGSQLLPALTVHLTEVTVGPRGPAAMQGSLPETSAYTYAVEITVDESGGRTVELSQPAALYVDNFLGFAPGSGIPVGAYDREQGRWAGLQNGIVLRILSVTNGVADLDTDGDGTADDAARLAARGISDGERAQLATLYAPDDVLWRSPIPHFSSIDCNRGFRLPADARFPGLRDPRTPDGNAVDDGCHASGSIIDCHNQALGEDIPVHGTPYALHYQSDRQAGRRTEYSLDIALSDDRIPASATAIALEVDVAGRVFRERFAATPNQHTVFTWDGKDAYGRMTQGRQLTTVSVGYVYRPTYGDPVTDGREFGQFPGAGIDRELLPRSTREEITISQRWETQLGPFDAQPLGLGGFTLDVHHTYDVAGTTLYLGNGETRRSTTLGGLVLERREIPQHAQGGVSVDSTAAVSLRANGGYYVANAANRVVYDEAGQPVAGIPTVITNPTPPCTFSGDGGPATEATLCIPNSLTVAPDGALYIGDLGRIRRVTQDGIIRAFAGKGRFFGGCLPTGIGGPARDAALCDPREMVASRDGALYFVDNGARIYKVSVDGTLSAIAGTGTPGYSGDGGPAGQAQLSSQLGLALALDGSLIVADRDNLRVRRISADGAISTIAGTGGSGDAGDGGLATSATFQSLGGVAVAQDGSIFISDPLSRRFRVINTTGLISAFAGGGSTTAVLGGDGRAPTDVRFLFATVVMTAPDGIVHLGELMQFGDTKHSLDLFRVVTALPAFSAFDRLIPSADGGELYVFDSAGRHLRTLDTFTSAVRSAFAYDAVGRLVGVTDLDGQVTQIERDESGNATAIVGPLGQRTSLMLDAHGYLAKNTDAAGGTSSFAYAPGGLLSTYTDPRGGVHAFTYDELGRLLTDKDPGQSTKTLARTSDGGNATASVTTALGRSAKYRVERLATGGETWLNTRADGTEIRVERTPDGAVTSHYPDGTVATQKQSPDPRFGMLAPVPSSLTIKTPGGRTQTQTTTRSVTLRNDDPTSVRVARESFSLNGKTFTRTYDATSKTVTIQSPLGRQVTATVNDKDRISNVAAPSRTGVQVAYDDLGRPLSIGQGARLRALTYAPDGRVATTSDALGRTIQFDRDPLGRVLRDHRPDGGSAAYDHDPASAITGVTPPDGLPHRFERDALGLVSRYVAPDAGTATSGTTYAYNADHQVTSMTQPDGRVATLAYDAAGRPNQWVIPDGTFDATYDAAGRLAAMTAPGGVDLSFGYDASLVTDVSWAGPVAGALHLTYDDDFRVASERVNSEPAIAAGYDRDGLLTSVGAMQIVRDVATGQIKQTSVGNVTESYTFDALGDLGSATATCGAATIRTTTLARDAVGGIIALDETLVGQTRSTTYEHDLTGRLLAVHEGAQSDAYTYDRNGNRLTAARPELVTDTYDAQDRLIQHGATTYSYAADGQLQTTTSGSDKTTYRYDLLGNLRSVHLPDGRALGYVIDGANRRVGKTVDGVLRQGFLYDGATRVVAELDGNAAVVSRFVYGTRSNVPDYMIKAGVTYRVLSDAVGSPRAIIDVASCEVAQQLDYDAFGRVRRDTRPGFQPFGFAGGLADRDTGLVRFGARDYDPEIGRWTAKDPLGFYGGDANLYAYAGDDPVDFNDPSGLSFRQGLTDFAAGFGDTMTFGLTRWVRQKLDVDSVVNPCSGWYSAGGVSAMVVGTVATAGIGGEGKLAAEGLANGAERLAGELTDSTFFHYTNEAGYLNILKNGAIRANASNEIFLTQEMLSSGETLNALFAGVAEFAGKGEYLIALDGSALALTRGAQFNELVHLGTIRLEGRLLFAGLNPF